MQHYTRNTESVAAWCNKCKGQTQHKVYGGRRAHCIPCFEKQEAEHSARKPEAPQPKQCALEFA
jgi:hypothetical protein